MTMNKEQRVSTALVDHILGTKFPVDPTSYSITVRISGTRRRSIRCLAVALASVVNLFSQVSAPSSGLPTTVVFDPPGSTGTYAESINNLGIVTGWYSDQTTINRYSFIRYPNGYLTTFGVPGSTTTQASAINDVGYVAGVFIDSSSKWRGFVRSPFGRFDLFDLPTQTLISAPAPTVSIPIGPQVVTRLNNLGALAGAWYHGFLRTLNGHMVVFDGPLSASVSVSGLNILDDVVGQYWGGDQFHGYSRTWDGAESSFDPPSSTSTDARAINNQRTIAGDFWQGNQYRGFIRDKHGYYVLVDVPGAQNTVIWDINEGGDVAGFTFDSYSYQNVRGFVRDSNGRYSMIEGMNALYAGHFVLGRCSLNEVGDIVGTHLDSDGLHGFIQFHRGLPNK